MNRARIIKCLSHFQVEIFAFFFILSVVIQEVTIQLMAQEKLCMSRYDDRNFCSNISRIEQMAEYNEKHFIEKKDEILAEVTRFLLYQQIITTVPVVATSMFISSWADRHPGSSKILLTLANIAIILESIVMLLCSVFFNSNVYLMLIASSFYPMSGGTQSFGMAIMAYISSTTKAANRVKRFSILEITVITSIPAGSFLGGQIVNSTALSEFARANGALHNYHYVFLASMFFKVVALVYVLLMKSKPVRVDSKTSEEITFSDSEVLPTEAKTALLESAPLLHRRLSNASLKSIAPKTVKLSSFFSFDNVKESFSVAFRRRPNGAHIQIWMMFATLGVYSMMGFPLAMILFQFVQKLYSWDAGKFTMINSSLSILSHLFGILVIVPFLRRILKVTDITMLLLGLFSYVCQNFVRGAIESVYFFFSSYAIGAMTPVVVVAARSQLAKIAPLNEQNRIFGVLTLLETLSPLLGVALFSTIFSHTVSIFAGAAYVTSSVILLILFILVSCLSFFGRKGQRKFWSNRKDSNNNPEYSSPYFETSQDSSDTAIFVG